MSGAQTQGLSIPLRSGETCALHGETLTVGQRPIPLRDIVSAGLVADVSVPTPPGMPPTPAVSLRLRDGALVAFTPVEQLDCWRLLQALGAARPELAAPLPPPPGAGYGATGAMGYAPPPPYGYAPPPYGYAPGYGMVGPTESEKTLAGFCHLSVFFAPLILPLIIWLAMSRSQPYASQQAKQAFFFHLGFSVLAVIGVVGAQIFYFSSMIAIGSSGGAGDPTAGLIFLPFILAGYGLLIGVGLIDTVYSIIGAVQAFQGKPFHYPLLGRLR